MGQSQLLRRASVAQELATSGVLDPAASIVLYEAAHAARQAEEEQREVAESELSQALRAVFAEAQQVEGVREAPGGEAAARELAEAVRRVPMARRFHNDAVGAARRLREHRKVRWFRLAGHAPFPMAFEMDAGLTSRRSTSSAAVRLPASDVYRQVSTPAAIRGSPDRMSRVVNVSSYSRTASASRPSACDAGRDPRGAAGLRRWARRSVARWARSAR